MKFAFSLLFILSIATSAVFAWQNHPKCGVKRKPFGRIIKGEDAEPHEFPWMSSLQQGGGHVCGASIIHSHWAVTAAHCLMIPYTNILVPAREFELVSNLHQLSNKSEPRVNMLIEKYFIYPNYTNITMDGDIALLKLSGELPLTDASKKIGTICLPEVEKGTEDLDHMVPVVGSKVTVTGWGVTENPWLSDILQKVNVTIVPQSNCAKSYLNLPNDNITITERMICAADVDKDSCGGDSGGPLVAYNEAEDKWFQEGVVSFGKGCALRNYPGVYARVRKVMWWVVETIDKVDGL